MRLQYNKNAKNPVLFVVESTYNHITKKRSNRVFENLGDIKSISERFNTNDPIAWAKNYVDEINNNISKNKISLIPRLSNTNLMPKERISSFNAGYLFLQKIYYNLKLDKLSESISKKYNFEFDFNSIFSSLIYSRITFPSSKRATCQYCNSFLEHVSIPEHQMYRALDIIAKEFDEIQSHMYHSSLDIIDRNIQVLYFDCSNFFCETNITDELRQYGVSKENRPSPIVGIALFIDGNGIPLAVDIYPGNRNEQLSLKPLEEKIMKDFSNATFIVCSDAGLNSDKNKKFHMVHNKHYVSTQPIKKLKSFLKDNLVDPNGWRLLNDDKLYNLNEVDKDTHFNSVFFKERWKNENGFEERIIVTFSFKYQDFQRKNRELTILKAEQNIKNNKTSKDKYINELNMTQYGELADKKVLSLNTKKIYQEEEFDGFYAVTTSLNSPISDIIRINKNRWQIEECFRILKSDLKSRPIYLTTPNRIRAHLLTCFLALYFVRILEIKLNYKFKYSDIINTLQNLNLTHLTDDNYIPAFTRTDLTDALQEAFGFAPLDSYDLRLDTEVIDNRKIKRIISFSKQKKELCKK